MDDRIIRNRITAVRQLLNKNKTGSLVVTKPANVTYITGFCGHDSWALITANAVYLLTDSRYIEQAKEQHLPCRVILRTGSMTETVAKLVKRLKSAGSIAVEKSISLGAFEALKKQLKNRLKTACDIIEQLRSSKDAGEIAAIRTAAAIAAEALVQSRPSIKGGMTENELAGMLDLQIRRLGAVNSFETIVAFGANASRPHHQPGGGKLKKNDTILIDFGVRYKGYCCDITRCLAVGKVTALYKKVYNAVEQAQAAAIEMVRAGVEKSKVDAAAREVIKKHDLPVYGHGTGHGLGLEIHEEPVISFTSKGKLKAGEIITIEPAVYIPGRIGVRIEDDVLVTRTGCEILSRNCLQLPLLT
jgi:Xaa-Pro aminopeptidase